MEFKETILALANIGIETKESVDYLANQDGLVKYDGKYITYDSFDPFSTYGGMILANIEYALNNSLIDLIEEFFKLGSLNIGNLNYSVDSRVRPIIGGLDGGCPKLPIATKILDTMKEYGILRLGYGKELTMYKVNPIHVLPKKWLNKYARIVINDINDTVVDVKLKPKNKMVDIAIQTIAIYKALYKIIEGLEHGLMDVDEDVKDIIKTLSELKLPADIIATKTNDDYVSKQSPILKSIPIDTPNTVNTYYKVKDVKHSQLVEDINKRQKEEKEEAEVEKDEPTEVKATAKKTVRKKAAKKATSVNNSFFSSYAYDEIDFGDPDDIVIDEPEPEPEEKPKPKVNTRVKSATRVTIPQSPKVEFDPTKPVYKEVNGRLVIVQEPQQPARQPAQEYVDQHGRPCDQYGNLLTTTTSSPTTSTSNSLAGQLLNASKRVVSQPVHQPVQEYVDQHGRPCDQYGNLLPVNNGPQVVARPVQEYVDQHGRPCDQYGNLLTTPEPRVVHQPVQEYVDQHGRPCDQYGNLIQTAPTHTGSTTAPIPGFDKPMDQMTKEERMAVAQAVMNGHVKATGNPSAPRRGGKFEDKSYIIREREARNAPQVDQYGRVVVTQQSQVVKAPKGQIRPETLANFAKVLNRKRLA